VKVSIPFLDPDYISSKTLTDDLHCKVQVVEMVSRDSSSALSSASIIAHLLVSSLSFISLLSFMHRHLGPKLLLFSFIKLCLVVWYLSLSLSR